MKRACFLLVLVLSACLDEGKADLGDSTTFVRYFNGGFDDEAVTVAETGDAGFLILANSQLEDGRNKIKLIKTDALGNKIWAKVYPEFTTNKADILLNRKGNGLLLTSDGGYVVVGEDIDAGKEQLYILVLDSDGNLISEETFPAIYSVRGIAISENSGNDQSYVVLGNIPGSNNQNMVTAEIEKSTLSISWTRTYGSGEASNLVNKLFLDSQDKLIWGGTVTRQNKSDVRLVRSIQDSQNTDFDLPIGDPNFNEIGADICRFGFGYAVTGNTDQTTSGEREIALQRLGEDGTVLFKTTFPITTTFNGEEVPVIGNKIGNAITTTQDGGLFLAGTVPSNSEINFGSGQSDYYLIKTNGFGTVMWRKSIGSRDADRSVAVLQAKDGGLVLLGNTTLADLKTILLMKMDPNGNIE